MSWSPSYAPLSTNRIQLVALDLIVDTIQGDFIAISKAVPDFIALLRFKQQDITRSTGVKSIVSLCIL
jgi:hypothetical protein